MQGVAKEAHESDHADQNPGIWLRIVIPLFHNYEEIGSTATSRQWREMTAFRPTVNYI